MRSDEGASYLRAPRREGQARTAIDRVLTGKKKYKSVADMIDAIYQHRREDDE